MAFFREEQRLAPWIWAVIAGVEAVYAYSVLEILRGRSRADRFETAVLLVSIVGLPLLIAACRLIVEVVPEGIRLRYIPFHRVFRTIPFERIARFEVRRYGPIREYGGWGIRWGRAGMAYSASGDRGLQLVLTDGRRILIGSARPDEFQRAVAAASRRS